MPVNPPPTLMKKLAIAVFCFVLLVVAQGFAQSGSDAGNSQAQTQNIVAAQPTQAPAPPVPPVNCAAMHAPESCASFNQMMKAGKFNDFLGNPRVKTWVCFRRNYNSFLVLHYFLPRYWATDRDETARIQRDLHDHPQRGDEEKYLRGVETSTPCGFAEYTDRALGWDLKATLGWKKLSEQDDSEATALSKGPDINISQAGILLSIANPSATTPFYWMAIDPDRTFTESYQSATPQDGGDSHAPPEKAYCAEF